MLQRSSAKLAAANVLQVGAMQQPACWLCFVFLDIGLQLCVVAKMLQLSGLMMLWIFGRVKPATETWVACMLAAANVLQVSASEEISLLVLPQNCSLGIGRQCADAVELLGSMMMWSASSTISKQGHAAAGCGMSQPVSSYVLFCLWPPRTSSRSTYGVTGCD
jgi:hypothetical protein